MFGGLRFPTPCDKRDDFYSSDAAGLRTVIDSGCRAMPPIGEHARLSALNALIEARAWTDAALLMLQLEAPGWRLRHLELDAEIGAWCCSLSRYPLMPVEFDDIAEGHDPLLPRAILAAIAEARLRPSPEMNARGAAQKVLLEETSTVWCENAR